MFVSDYSTTVMHGAWKKLKLAHAITENKIFSFLTTVLLHGISDLNPNEKNIHFRFWLQYFYGA